MDDTSHRMADLSPEKRAFLAKRFRATSNAAQLLVSEPIAVIGIGCRFPGQTQGPAAFWELLRAGVDAIADIPPERWDIDKLYDPNPDAPGKMTTRWGGFLTDIDQFDARFFGIAPREAMTMDPQQRLFLEVAWEALEHAGQPIDTLAGSATGVFVGASSADYGLLQSEQQAPIDMYNGTGSALNILAGRLAYLLDLRGPCVTVDTACSSSLVAVHLACQSLRLGESQLALAGGVNLVLSARATINMSKMGIMASDGRCKTFDARANGFVRSEGCGVVVLKRLSDAIADNDPILALVRGSAVNQDGRSSGLTAPNVQAQKAVIRAALAQAGVAPEHISYVETHGTGTALGDPIEVEALGEVIGQRDGAAQPCWLGAVKTNLGHLEAAAGIAGLIKTVLALQHKTIPVNLHLRTLNPHLALEQTRFALPTTLQPWPALAGRRYAGVSSFGWSGTNAHVILEEAPRAPEQASGDEEPSRAYLLPVSARSAPALAALARSYHALLTAADAPPLRDLCSSASLRRMHHEHRLAVVGGSRDALAEQLQRLVQSGPDTARQSGPTTIDAPPKLVFVFPGQGAQWAGMGRELLAQEPVFRAAIEACAAAFQPYVTWSLLEQLQRDVAQASIDVVQPLLFAIAVGLSALWQSWGVTPAAVIGHSMGEIAAAYVAGALTLDDAARIICGRSKLLRRISGQGAMAMIELSLEEAQAALAGYEDRAAVAVSNSPRSTVIAGEPAALDEVISQLEARQVFCRRVKVDVAAHSPQVDPLAPTLSTLLAGLRPQPSRIPFYSTVDQAVLDGRELDGAYWMRNLRQPVRFATMIQQLADAGHQLFIELSPHPILLPAISECLQELGAQGTVLPSLRRAEPERAVLLGSLGAVYREGSSVTWSALYPDKGRYVPLPPYPWQRERYWFQESPPGARPAEAQLAAGLAGHPLAQTHLRPADQPGAAYWETTVSLARLPYLADHQVQGLAVLPATAYLDLALEAGRSLFDGAAVTIEQVALRQMLILGPDDEATLQIKLVQDQPAAARFEIMSRPLSGEPARWTSHVSGLIRRDTAAPPEPLDLRQAIERCPQHIPAESYYERLAARGFGYGPAFQGIVELWQGSGEAVARLTLSPSIAPEQALYALHPALLDASFQALDACFPDADQRDPYLPVQLERLRHHASTSADLWAYVRSHESGDAATRTGDILLLDAAGQVLVEARGLRLQRPQATQRSLLDSWLYEIGWRRQERPATAAATGPWLIFADAGGLGHALASQLAAQGAACTLVLPGSGQLAERDGCYQLDRTQPQMFRDLLHAVGTRSDQTPQHVVFLWGVAAGEAHELDLSRLEAAQTYGALSALYLVQALAQSGWRKMPRLWLVTRGTQAAGAVADVQLPAAAPLWGLGRTIMHEHPDTRCTLVDLPADGAADELAELVAELVANTAEHQVALREGGRYVARLARSRLMSTSAPHSPALTPAGQRPFRLERTAAGLTLRATSRRVPGPGEVEIQVIAAGLSGEDRQALAAADQDHEPEPQGVGSQCAGTITAIGPDVVGLAVGDAVVACAPGSASRFVTTSAHYVAHKPAQLSFEEAAGLPFTFAMAAYVVQHLAHLQPGERILIHASAGEIGRAALQIAQQIGAEIIATASSAEQRRSLQEAGVALVCDARSFGNELATYTGGQGVDVVVSAPDDQARAQSLAAIGGGGRMIEVGYHRRVAQPLDLGSLRSSLSFSVVDLAQMQQLRPALVQKLLQQVMQQFADGALRPLPIQSAPIGEAVAALAQQTDAMPPAPVLTLHDAAGTPIVAAPITIRPDASYLLTGGLGGLGLSVAHWLVAQGARSLILLSRRPPAPALQPQLAALRAAGVTLTLVAADISQPAALAALLRGQLPTLPPLRGVFHAAGLLDDGILLQQTAARFTTVCGPKLAGAWNLHAQTAALPLDWFVLCSSAAAVLGAPGQGNYAAANAFLDALAAYRQAQGLPALSINWGPWAEVGMAAAHANGGERVSYRGIASITPAQGVEMLGRLLRGAPAQVAVLPLNLRQWRQSYPQVAAAPLFSELAGEEQQRAAGLPPASIRARLNDAPPTERRRLLEEQLQALVAQVLRLAPEQITADAAFPALGFDSLMAIEFRNRLETLLDVVLPTTLVWAYPTLALLADYLADKIGLTLPPAAEQRSPAPPAEDRAALHATLAELSDDEAEALLLAKLAAVGKRGSL